MILTYSYSWPTCQLQTPDRIPWALLDHALMKPPILQLGVEDSCRMLMPHEESRMDAMKIASEDAPLNAQVNQTSSYRGRPVINYVSGCFRCSWLMCFLFKAYDSSTYPLRVWPRSFDSTFKLFEDEL
ncbi:hypothetical protein N7468_006299 [Penicillium chermesinum]|uniref:Uncharacterized protein n=1 Tax=Penicillium chermesinum TaxID=63820 RepID=A0A9W9NS43_9EURO|nr:uncharacterized protein N7468_006299 [Penicillium chermesinum]KAJ5225074.1 hypothetical protein N7468_006299 [Penicillium chermesinum]